MKHARKFCISLLTLIVTLLLLCGPGGTWLQSRETWADPDDNCDALYLVCGARAQDRRITALVEWTQHVELGTPNSELRILIGNDPQKSLWCRKHQTNHTKTEWAEEKLKSETGGQRSEDEESLNNSALSSPIVIVPGTFSNTDGEVAALAQYLKDHPEIQSIALVTSRFHARRLLQRYDKHIGQSPTVSIISGVNYWENRAPWIILGEYAKMLRDQLGLTNKLTRSDPRTAEK